MRPLKPDEHLLSLPLKGQPIDAARRRSRLYATAARGGWIADHQLVARPTSEAAARLHRFFCEPLGSTVALMF